MPQLLKLASLEPDSLALDLTIGTGATTVTLIRRDRRFEVPEPALDRLGPLLGLALSEIVPVDVLVATAETACTELARDHALREVVGTMLAAPSLEKALAAFVAGVTAGSGLGFHRAALFMFDPARKVFAGSLGIGPADEAEAHRIWESLESEAVSFDKQLVRAGAPSTFSDRVKSLTLAATTEDADEVRQALTSNPCIFVRPDGPSAHALSALDPAREFVLLKIAAREHVLGLLFADRRFGDGTVDPGVRESVSAFVGHAALVWETLRLLREIEELARYDVLTSLLNRREFESRFTQERSRAQRASTALTLLLIDLDHFREVNNQKGHQAGDQILKTFGALLRAELRGHDVPARFGGDELAIILPGAGPFEAALVARRIGLAAHRRGIPISIGSASFPEDCDHPDDLVSVADANLYAAKNGGRGRACLAGDGAAIVFADEDGS